MTVRSSEVLRLAAEYALDGVFSPIYKAAVDMVGYGPHWDIESTAMDCADVIGYFDEFWPPDIECMALCLAAAIAEDEGD